MNVSSINPSQTGQPDAYLVRHVLDDPYQIVIETNDDNVITYCDMIHSECHYKLKITSQQKYTSKDPWMMRYFRTERMSDLPIFKALGMSLKKILDDRIIFDRSLENLLILNGYQKFPGEDKVYVKKLK